MIEKHVEIVKNMGFIPETILEVGSRDGHDSKFYQNSFNVKDENVFIVEPNPTQFERISIDYPNYTLFNYAISLKEGVSDFNQVINGGAYGMDPIGVSSLLDRSDDFYRRFETIKVKVNTITGKTLMSKINKDIDICKIDVEGLSYEVIESFGDEIQKIKTIHVETEHVEFWSQQKLHSDVVELLQSKNFEMVYENKNPSQSDTVWINKQKL